MNQSPVAERERLIGGIEAPVITPLGSLDDDLGDTGMGLDTTSPKPVLAIIYPGV